MLKDDVKLLLSEYVTEGALETIKKYYWRFDEPFTSITKEEITYLKILLILSKNLQRAKDFIDKYSKIVKRPWTIKDVLVAIYGEDETTRVRKLLDNYIRAESDKRRTKSMVEKKHKNINKTSKPVKRKLKPRKDVL